MEFMSELVYLAGSEAELCSQLISLGISDEDSAKRILTFIDENKDLINGLENYTIIKNWPKNHAVKQMLSGPSVNYRIGIRIKTIAIISIILGLHVSKGLAVTLKSLYKGFDQNTFQLNEFDGETCVAKVAFLQGNNAHQGKMLAAFNGECHNIDFNCKYREFNRCMCNEDAVAAITFKLNKKKFLPSMAARYDTLTSFHLH